MYPKCAHTFRNWCLSNLKYEKLYYGLGEPQPFDVTLRDGLQSLPKDIQKNYITNDKLKMYHNIIFNYKPINIEIGSMVSEKVLPIFKDTLDIFNTLNTFEIKHNETTSNPLDSINKYILVGNKEHLKNVINNPTINHFSLITSVSNSFQQKNTKMTLEESDKDIKAMLHELDNNKNRKVEPVVKLYVSCINECPIEGKIDNDFIINRLLNLNNNMKIDTFCLSDTCGSLLVDDFEYIVDTCKFFGLVPINKLSLHLHVKKGKEDEAEKIIHKALDYKIRNFDVSTLDSGGCSVTMNKDRLVANLSYELYYKSLCNYIMKKT